MTVFHSSFSVMLLVVLVLTRIVGGAILLYLLAAPGWAIAFWLMLHLRIGFATTPRRRLKRIR